MINLYKASAGSGKTYTLVQEYLKLLLGFKLPDGSYRLNTGGENSHRSILAITFTNKATDEMKQRIVKELDILGSPGKESPYMPYLSSTLHASPDAIRERARKALFELLFDFTNFNISTIDTFFQRILRTFAYEAEVSFNYEVELDTDYAVSVGISDLKQSLHAHGQTKENRLLLQWLSDFMQTNINEGKSWNIFRESMSNRDMTLSSFARELSKETVKRHNSELLEYLSDKQRIISFMGELSEKGKAAARNVIEAATRFLPVAAGLAGKFSKQSRLDEKLAALATGNWTESQKNYVINAYGHPEKWFTKTVLPTIGQDDIDRINACIGDVTEGFKLLDSFKLISSQLYFLGLLGDIAANVRDFTTENNVILLADTNEMLKKIINEDDTPYIYERVGIKLKHFLIDEFQDTSRMQWDNMEPLLRNSLSEDNDNLIIGDVKQSIYRFRGSDPNLLRNEIRNRFDRRTVRETGSDTNWRSAKNVIEWNNRFFSLLAGTLGMDDIYANVVQKASKEKDGYVRVEQIPASQQDFRETALDRMVSDILSMLERGYALNDITVLVNRNTEGQEVIAKLLEFSARNPQQPRLNVVSEESLLIRKSAAVKIIVSILALLDEGSESSRKNLAMLLKLYEYNVSSSGMDASAAIAEALSGNTADIDTEFLLSTGECAGLNAIVERIILKIPEKIVANDTAYIQAFQDRVTDFESRFGSNLHKFLKWWEESGKNTAISSPDNIEAIKVMTVHKSKGLEFPCVIIPFCDWDFDKGGIEWIIPSMLPDYGFAPQNLPPILPVYRGNSPNTLFQEQFLQSGNESIMDALNKTYVAFTRAVDELVIYYPEKKSKKGTEPVKDMASAFTSLLPLMPFPVHEPALEIGTPASRHDTGSKKSDDNIRTMPDYEVNYRPEIWHFDVPDLAFEPRQSPKFKGVAMHSLMRKIAVRSDLGHALKQFLTKGLITPEEAEEFGQIIRQGLSDPRVAEWFAAGNRLYAERTIINAKKGEYRPDRIILTPDGRTIVVDYKFGEKIDKKYERQVRNYMRLAANAGLTGIEGYVWYVTDAHIIPVNLQD